ncbi:MAG: undecaprenyldiphospho-muramoylpentapeptide beta-N-acetylglucosaminyltransferase [Paludibacter sp.]
MNPKFLISGGGTGGHIFPAISIANALKKVYPTAKILFVGAAGRMEMDRVPAAGYEIIGLPVSGFDRKSIFRNFRVLYNLLKSLVMARKIVKNFRPDVAIGVGGYASGPTLYAASVMGVPSVIQEQNSYAGVTNKLLAKKAERICVAYDGMERFFPKEKIILTGNPIRQNLINVEPKSNQAYLSFNLDPTKKTILVVGGSLGARTINQSLLAGLNKFKDLANVQIIWQTGKNGYKETLKASKLLKFENVIITDFVSSMDLAYSIADLVVSRAGASSISELCLLAKPVILVPSPNVAEDHQTQNALALVRKDAAVMIKDADAGNQLVDKMIELINNDKELKKLSDNILKLAEKDSADRIANEIIKLIQV